MGDTWISDLRHFLDGGGDLSPYSASRPLARQLCCLVDAVTRSPSDEPVSSGILCRRRPNRKRCEGVIAAGFGPGVSRIRWACPLCGDNGWISGWHGTHWDRGGRGRLPDIHRVTWRSGLVDRHSQVERLPVHQLSGIGIPREVLVAIHDNEIIAASGEYGDPDVGEPIQYHELRIEHGTGTDRIVVYNLAIMILGTGEEIYPRVLRVFSALERPAMV